MPVDTFAANDGGVRWSHEANGISVRPIPGRAQCDVGACVGGVYLTSDTSYVTIWAARVGLSDLSHAEVHAGADRALCRPAVPVLDGERPHDFRREDRGGGIAIVGFVVDGQMLQERPSQLVPSDVQASVRTRSMPCPLRLDTDDEARHHCRSRTERTRLQVALTDVAGNRRCQRPVRSRGPQPRRAERCRCESSSQRLDAWLASQGHRRRSAGVVPYRPHTRRSPAV